MNQFSTIDVKSFQEVDIETGKCNYTFRLGCKRA